MNLARLDEIESNPSAEGALELARILRRYHKQIPVWCISSLDYEPAETDRFGYVDVETTGLESTDEIIELALAVVEYDVTELAISHVVGTYRSFQEPSGRIPAEATAIHGITWDMVKGHSINHEELAPLLRQCSWFCAHNASFDSGFINREMSNRWPSNAMWRCSSKGINWRRRGFANGKLQDLLAAHRIDPGSAHRALDDVLASIELLKREDYFRELVEGRRKGAGRARQSSVPQGVNSAGSSEAAPGFQERLFA